MEITNIIDAIHAHRIRITDHADEEAESDQLTFDEIYSSVFNGEIIEEYHDDRPYPSCLIYGKTSKNRPLHVVCAHSDDDKLAIIVTAYQPNPERWIDFSRRKK